jgi:hypothetical protein
MRGREFLELARELFGPGASARHWRGAKIQAVFDPYLDNAALTTVVDILSFGGTLANDVRLLSSPRMTQGANPKLTKSLVTTWFGQRAIAAGESSVVASAGASAAHALERRSVPDSGHVPQRDC